MSKRYITPKIKHTQSRKYNGKCQGCGQPKALNEVFCYVDDVNPAINYNSPYLCKECYEKRYNNNVKKRKEAIYLGFCSHDCEAHYKCPVCNKNFGSWSLPREKQAKKCCPWCNTELDGLE